MLFEVFKSHHKLGPRIMHDIFQVNENAYSLRSGITFTVSKYQRNGTNKFDFRAVLAWNSLPKSVKDTDSLSVLNLI